MAPIDEVTPRARVLWSKLAVQPVETRQRNQSFRFAIIAAGLLAALTLLPSIRSTSRLALSFWGAVGCLGLSLIVLQRRVSRARRQLTTEWKPRKAHYVQLLMHSAVYVYWGWYWREVYRYAPLLVSQIILAYAIEMIHCWWRRDNWQAGFAPIPIVLSTNLFLWFHQDWFFLQFLMIAVAVSSKELLRWKLADRRSHIFNPSALALFLFSAGLIILHANGLSRAGEIAFTLAYPPNIYFQIFLIGLVLQAMFSITLVTLTSIATLVLLNVWYTQMTGAHRFVDSNIPVLVFLGAHLLITDPATSPRTAVGKVWFGVLYGGLVFVLRGVLSRLDTPTYYDKLLCVPLLNLSVPLLDQFGAKVQAFLSRNHLALTNRVVQANLAHMSMWILLFTIMVRSGFLLYSDAGSGPSGRGCLNGNSTDCIHWIRSLKSQCSDGSAIACSLVGQVLSDGRVVPRDPWSASAGLKHACELGYTKACGLSH